MRFTYKLCLVIFSVQAIIISGCGGNDKEYINLKEVSLSIDSVRIPPVLLFERRLVATSSYLISMNIDSDTLFRVFDLPDLKYRGAFGTQGKGPLEFLYPNVSSLQGNNDGIFIADIRNLHLMQFPKAGKIQNSNVDRKIYARPGMLQDWNSIFLLNDSVACGARSTNTNGELTSFNFNLNTINDIVDFPTLNPGASRTVLGSLYAKEVSISPDKKRIVMAYIRFPLLRLYDIETGGIKEIFTNEGPRQVELEFDKLNILPLEQYSYYKDIKTTNKRVYALFQVVQIKITKAPDGTPTLMATKVTSKQMHIFDWSGNPVGKFEVPDWFNAYAIDANDQLIYFLNPDRENVIYTYSLTGLN